MKVIYWYRHTFTLGHMVFGTLFDVTFVETTFGSCTETSGPSPSSVFPTVTEAYLVDF